MRTPGQCTNVEGCWIGATHRNVWLSIGEDFACPNCGGVLTPPPRRAISLQRLKKAAAIGAALSAGVAASAVIGVKLSGFHWVPQPQAVASRHAGNSVLAMLTPALPPRPQAPGQNAVAVTPSRTTAAVPAPQAIQPQSTALAADAEGHTQPTFADPEKPGRIAAHDPGTRTAKTLPGLDVLFGNAPNTAQPLSEQSSATPHQEAARQTNTQLARTKDMGARDMGAREIGATDAATQQTHSPEIGAVETREAAAGENEDPAFPAAAMVTMVSEAPFVLPIDDVRTLVLPVTFGEPQGPEDATPPVSLRWRAHGLIRTRSSYFLPISAERDNLEKICRTPEDLR